MKKYLFSALMVIALSASAQVASISFETQDFKNVSVYDNWENSPFRKGTLHGNAKVVDNPNTNVDATLGTAPNPTAKVVAVERSKYGSNTFGVRIDLNEPFRLTKDLQYIHQAGNVLYFGRVPGAPEVGDVRVTFEKVVPAKVTVMAVVDGDTFKPFKAKNGKRFQTLVMGQKSGDEIIEAEKEANNMILWFLRILGVMIVIGGLKGIFGFIETILKVVPFIAGIFGWGVGLVCTVLGVVWSLIVIALAWLFYRPLLGISLLVLAGLLIWVFAFKGKDKLKELAAKGKAKNAEPLPATE